MNDPIPNTFDPANARELCALSVEAYGGPPAAETPGLWCEAAGTHVRLHPRPDGLLVAFRGTADLRDWLTDLDCELIRAGDFRVHRGFHQAVRAVEPALDDSLAQARPTRLWVTGHSLGGALAKLWALRAAGRGHAVAGVYTFGQPRVGDAAFAAHYNSLLQDRSFRIVHADDVVPRLPWVLGRYRHAGHEVFFPSGASAPVLDCPLPRKLLYDIPGLLREAFRDRLALLEDHHISRYLALFAEPSAEICPSQLPTLKLP
jgi:triacylglycerol lipase